MRVRGELYPAVPQPAPEVIGCVNCGGDVQPDQAVFAQCERCGRTCGVCKLCVEGRFTPPRGLGTPLTSAQSFVNESMRRHLTMRHPAGDVR